MNKKYFVSAVLTAVMAIATGCVNTVDGNSHLGDPVGKDRVEGRYERSVQQLVEAARAVLKLNGALVADNSVNNSLQGKVNQENVWVRVEEMDPVKPVTRIFVEARTAAGNGDIELAHDIEKQIGFQVSR